LPSPAEEGLNQQQRGKPNAVDLGNEALASYVSSEAKKAVKVLAFSSPLWKRGVGGGFIIK